MDAKETKQVFNLADYKGLSEPERRIFKSALDEMDKRGLFRAADVPIIAAYARNVVLARVASDSVIKYGVMIEETDKYHGTKLRENPAINVMQKAQKSAQEFAVLLGITPVGRKRTKTEEKPTRSALDDFMDSL